MSQLSENQTTSQPEQPQITESSHTIISDQRIVTDEAARVFSSTPATASATAVVSEQPYTMDRTFSKPIMLGSFDWTTASVQHALLARYDVSDLLRTNPSQPYSLQRMFKILQYGVDIEIMSQGTIYHQGTLIAFFNPLDTCKVPINAYSVSGFPSILIDAAVGTPAKMHIPYAHIYPFLTTGTAGGFPNTIGTINILVLNQLEIGTGASPRVPIAVYATPRDSKLHMAIYDHEPLVTPTPLIELNNVPHSKILDRVEKGASGISKLLKDGEGILSDIFCDNPERLTNEGRITQNNAAFTHSDQPTYSEVLDTCPTYGYFPQEAVTNGNQGDEHSISKIIRIPMLTATINWTTAQVIGETLVNTFVLPINASIIDSPTTTTETSSFQPTFLSNMSTIHAFWEGDIEYTFYMVKTKFVTGRLLIAYVPLEERVSPTYTIEQLQACPNMVIDVKDEKLVYKFVVPYIGNTPRKFVTPVSVPNYPGPPEVFNGKFLQFNNDAAQILETTYPSIYHSGKLVVAVLNPLTAPPSVADTIHFNVYVNAGDNFTYHNATIPNTVFDRGFIPISNNPQSGEVPESSFSRSSAATATNVNKLQLGDGTRISSPGYTVPIHDSVLTHIKRYYIDVRTYIPTNLPEQIFVYQTTPFSATLTAAEDPTFNIRDFIVGQYVFYTGSQK